jgi:murein lipoprotein
MRLNGNWAAVALAAVLAIGSVGCASRGSVTDLERRIDEVAEAAARAQRRAEAAEERAVAAEREADRAVSRADAASNQAAEAAKNADAAARRAEAIFEKSVRK